MNLLGYDVLLAACTIRGWVIRHSAPRLLESTGSVRRLELPIAGSHGLAQSFA
jgi:hypothetical protein